MTAASRPSLAATRVIHKCSHSVVVPHRRRATTRSRVTSPPPFLSNPLRCRLQNWEACAPNAWILRTIANGCSLQFSRQPPLTAYVKFTSARGESLATLRGEICALLDKGATQQVNLARSPSGFYSKYFLVKKKGGGVRPTLDLQGLNASLKELPFRMLTSFHEHLPSAQEVSALRLRWQGVPIYRSPVRDVIEPSRVLEVHSGGDSTATRPWSPPRHLSLRLADLSGLSGGGDPAYTDGCLAPNLPRFSTQPGEELFGPVTACWTRPRSGRVSLKRE